MEVTQKTTEDVNALFTSGNAHFKMKEYDAAIEDYSNILLINPNDSNAYYNRGLSYSNKKESNKAIADYTEVIRLNPDFYDAYINRGLLYIGNTLYKDYAIKDFTKAIQMLPNDPKTYYYRSVAKSLNDPPITESTEVEGIVAWVITSIFGTTINHMSAFIYAIKMINDLKIAEKLAPNDDFYRNKLQEGKKYKNGILKSLLKGCVKIIIMAVVIVVIILVISKILR